MTENEVRPRKIDVHNDEKCDAVALFVESIAGTVYVKRDYER